MHLGMTGRFSIDQANGKSLELGDFGGARIGGHGRFQVSRVTLR